MKIFGSHLPPLLLLLRVGTFTDNLFRLTFQDHSAAGFAGSETIIISWFPLWTHSKDPISVNGMGDKCFPLILGEISSHSLCDQS